MFNYLFLVSLPSRGLHHTIFLCPKYIETLCLILTLVRLRMFHRRANPPGDPTFPSVVLDACANVKRWYTSACELVVDVS